jgi:hypothetical protein
MSRLVALTVAITLGISPVTFAGEGLMESASRAVSQQVENTTTRPSATRARTVAVSNDSARRASGWTAPTFAAQQGGQVLSKSGMRRRTKVMIYLAAGVGLASAAWAIDHQVLDVTPSSLGTRRDGCKPFCGSPE